MLRLAFLQSVKQKIHGIFIILVVLAGVAGIYHVKQRDEVLFFLRRFIVDISDQRRVIKALRFHPKIFGALCALALGIDNDGINQFQNVFLRAQIRKRVIVHTLGKVDGVENGDAVFCPLQKLSYLANQAAFWVSNDIRAVKLHDIRLAEKPCLSAARAADDKNILISRVLWVFGAVGHHQPFRLCQQHIVVKDGINERLDVCRCTPTRRAVLHALAVFLGVFLLGVDHQPDNHGCGKPNQQIGGMEAGGGAGKGSGEALPDM